MCRVRIDRTSPNALSGEQEAILSLPRVPIAEALPEAELCVA